MATLRYDTRGFSDLWVVLVYRDEMRERWGVAGRLISVATVKVWKIAQGRPR